MAHAKVAEAVTDQVKELIYSTTLFHHPVLAHLAEERAATMPSGQ